MPKPNVNAKPRISLTQLPSSDRLTKNTVNPRANSQYPAAPMDAPFNSIERTRLFSLHDITKANRSLSRDPDNE